jgi:ribonuclease P protein component
VLPKQYRLNKNKDFKVIFQKGRNFFIKEFGIKILKNNLEILRFGFIVSNKVTKKANKRNLIKRRMREIVRKNLPNMRIGADAIIIARPEIKNLKFSELKEKIEKALWQIRLL